MSLTIRFSSIICTEVFNLLDWMTVVNEERPPLPTPSSFKLIGEIVQTLELSYLTREILEYNSPCI